MQKNNAELPPTHLVSEKFKDFVPAEDVGATRHHLRRATGGVSQ